MKLSEKLLRYLYSAGINNVFGIVGREATEILFDEYAEKVKFILTRHELTAGVAASAMSRFLNKPQVCFGTLGPGPTNYMTAIGTAMLDRNPLIIITAQIESSGISHNDAHQCIDAVSMVKPITKFAYELRSPSELKYALESAVSASMTYPYGPSFLSIPIDFLSTTVPDDDSKLSLHNSSLTSYITLSTDFEINLEKIVEMLKTSKNPLIVPGDTVLKTKDGPKLVRKLAEVLNIPVVTPYSTKGVLPHNHRLNFGTISSHLDPIINYPALYTLFEEPDMLLLLGYDLIEHFPSAWGKRKPKKIAQINPYLNTSHIAIKPDVIAVGPLDIAIKGLIENASIIGKKLVTQPTELRARIADMEADKKTYKEGLLPNQILDELNKHYKDDYILANDIGMNRHMAGIFFHANKPNDFVTSAGFSSFGTGLAMGVGAKLANPNRHVVVVAGDGGLHSNSGDIETIVRLRLKIVIVVFNNDMNGLIKRFQLIGKNKRNHPETIYFKHVDFAKLAEANGCKGLYANSRSEFKKALLLAEKHNGPTIIDAKVYYPKMYINSD